MNDILNQSTVVKKYEIKNPDFDEVAYLLDKVIKGFRKKNIFTRLNTMDYI